jgi:dTDP-4-amino-4,6-dideoxygalactose transaminase
MHGESTKYNHDVIGLNSRLDSIQAAVLSVKLEYLDAWCEARIARASTYQQLFMNSGLVGKQLLAIPPGTVNKSHVFNNYCVRAERRDHLRQFLAEAGIQSEIYYPVPQHLQKCFANLGYKPGDFPCSEAAARQILALPLYPELTVEQQATVVAAIVKFYQS